MRIADLIRSMTAAGAPPEAIAIAVEAIEAGQARDEERRAKQAARKARSRAGQGRDSHATVTGQSQDPSPLPPGPPIPTPSRVVLPPSPPSEAPAPKGADRSRGTRISPDWALDDIGRAYAGSIGLTPAEIDHEAAKFRDHWLAKAGADGRKADWAATWRTWARIALDRRGRSNGTRAGPQSPFDFKNGFFQAAAEDRRS